MYNFFEYFFILIIFVLGLYMAIDPKNATKEENRNDEDKVAKIRRNGFVLIATSVIGMLVSIIISFMS